MRLLHTRMRMRTFALFALLILTQLILLTQFTRSEVSIVSNSHLPSSDSPTAAAADVINTPTSSESSTASSPTPSPPSQSPSASSLQISSENEAKRNETASISPPSSTPPSASSSPPTQDTPATTAAVIPPPTPAAPPVDPASILRPPESASPAVDRGARFNYAAFDAGAKLLAMSDGMKKGNSILVADDDRYLTVPCDQEHKWFVIQLSEDIIIDTIELANLEHYASSIRDFQVLGSATHPTSQWLLLGSYTALDSTQKQVFTLPSAEWVRFIKIRWVSHYGAEYYCTLTYLRVYGMTMLETFREEMQKSEEDVKEITNKMKLDNANANANANGNHANTATGTKDEDSTHLTTAIPITETLANTVVIDVSTSAPQTTVVITTTLPPSSTAAASSPSSSATSTSLTTTAYMTPQRRWDFLTMSNSTPTPPANDPSLLKQPVVQIVTITNASNLSNVAAAATAAATKTTTANTNTPAATTTVILVTPNQNTDPALPTIAAPKNNTTSSEVNSTSAATNETSSELKSGEIPATTGVVADESKESTSGPPADTSSTTDLSATTTGSSTSLVTETTPPSTTPSPVQVIPIPSLSSLASDPQLVIDAQVIVDRITTAPGDDALKDQMPKPLTLTSSSSSSGSSSGGQQSIFKALTNRIKELEIAQAMTASYMSDQAERYARDMHAMRTRLDSMVLEMAAHVARNEKQWLDGWNLMNQTAQYIQADQRRVLHEISEEIREAQYVVGLVEGIIQVQIGVTLLILVFYLLGRSLLALTRHLWRCISKSCRRRKYRANQAAAAAGGRLAHHQYSKSLPLVPLHTVHESSHNEHENNANANLHLEQSPSRLSRGR